MILWREHLYGDEENTGLISQLKKRAGVLKKLSKYTSRKTLALLANGIFYSKLEYCLPVFGNISGLTGYAWNARMKGMTIVDCNRLQVVQNTVMRILTGARMGTRTKDLLQETGSLSVHQLIAYTTLMMVFNVKKNGKPEYLARKLYDARSLGGRDGPKLRIPDYSLDLARAGFVYRGAKLFNMLPRAMREERKKGLFKSGIRKWIAANVSIRP